MKKLLLVCSVFLLCSNSNAQLCQPIKCDIERQYSGGISNTMFDGNLCINGDHAVLTNSANVNNWDYITLKGTVIVNQTINFQNGPKKLYIAPGADVQLNNNVSMDNYDTIFVKDGAKLVITSIPVTNNSYTNVIVRSAGSQLRISGIDYNGTVNDTLRNNPVNPTNIVVITNCHPTALPIDTTNHSVKPIVIKHKSEWWNSEVTVCAVDGRKIYQGKYNPDILPRNQVLIVMYSPLDDVIQVHRLILQ